MADNEKLLSLTTKRVQALELLVLELCRRLPIEVRKEGLEQYEATLAALVKEYN